MAKVTINDRKLFKQVAQGDSIYDACYNLCSSEELKEGHTYSTWVKYVPTEEELDLLLNHQVVRINIEVDSNDN